MCYTNLYKVVSQPWLTTKEIMLVAQCGRNSAIKIRKQIEDEIIKEGKLLPPSYEKVIPTNKLLKALDINIDYVFQMALKEKQYNNGGDDYVS